MTRDYSQINSASALINVAVTDLQEQIHEKRKTLLRKGEKLPSSGDSELFLLHSGPVFRTEILSYLFNPIQRIKARVLIWSTLMKPVWNLLFQFLKKICLSGEPVIFLVSGCSDMRWSVQKNSY